MYVKTAVKDSIKLSLKRLYMVDIDFCVTDLKKSKFDPASYLTATKSILVYPVNCCSNYTNMVSNTIHASNLCIV